MSRGFVLASALWIAACGQPEPATHERQLEGGTQREAPPPPETKRVETPLEDALDFVRRVDLEEPPEAFVMAPSSVMDGQDAFLMADRGMHQVRRYFLDGRLQWRFGRKGRGPTDLLEPTATLRLPDSTIFVASYTSFDSRWSSDGRRVLETYSSPDFLPPHLPRRVALVGDSLVAIANRARFNMDTTLAEPIVSLFDPNSGEIVRKVFAPRVDQYVGYAVGTDGFAAVGARGDTLAVAFSKADSLYLLNSEGEILERLAIPFSRYRVSDLPPEEWLQQSLDQVVDETTVVDIDWLSDGSFLVYFRDRRTGPKRVSWVLLQMTRQGRFVFETQIGQLRLVDAARRQVYLQDPASLEPSRWLVYQVPWAGGSAGD